MIRRVLTCPKKKFHTISKYRLSTSTNMIRAACEPVSAKSGNTQVYSDVHCHCIVMMISMQLRRSVLRGREIALGSRLLIRTLTRLYPVTGTPVKRTRRRLQLRDRDALTVLRRRRRTRTKQ